MSPALATLAAPRASAAPDLERPVFVCGVGRSGTTLLQCMLDASPELCMTPETHFFRRYVVPGDLRRRLEAAGPAAFAAHLAGDLDFARSGLDAELLLAPDARRARAGRPWSLARTYARLLGACAARAGKPRAGDKDPRLLDHLAPLHAARPQARVVHVVRDPRDVVLSRTRAAWSAGRPWWLHALLGAEQERRGREAGRRLFGGAYLELAYEELLARPEAALRRVCAHVGIAFDPAMLAFGERAQRLVDARELSWKREVFGPLLASNAGKWRSELAPARARWVEALWSEPFRAGGRAARGDDPRPAGAARLLAPAAAPLARALARTLYGPAQRAASRRAARRDAPPPAAAVVEGLAPERLGRWRVLFADEARVIAASGLALGLSRDGGRRFEPLATAPGGPLRAARARAPLVARLLREGFHALLPLADGALVAVGRGAVLHLPAGERRFRVAHRVRRGTRPLGVCRAPSGRLFFGEYFANPAREPVHVYGSADGARWDVVHTFPAGAIRHVHAVVTDPWRGGLWVLSGDEGAEAALWWTDDEFRTLEPVVRGVQAVRCVGVLPLAAGLVTPTDTPHEPNAVHLLDPATGRSERLAELPGSAFATARAGELLLVATAVEKSAVNRDQRPALLASGDGLRWRTVARFARDLPWLRDRRGYLRYPTLALPAFEGAPPFVLATGQSIAGAEGRLLRWRSARLRALLAEDAP